VFSLGPPSYLCVSCISRCHPQRPRLPRRPGHRIFCRTHRTRKPWHRQPPDTLWIYPETPGSARPQPVRDGSRAGAYICENLCEHNSACVQLSARSHMGYVHSSLVAVEQGTVENTLISRCSTSIPSASFTTGISACRCSFEGSNLILARDTYFSAGHIQRCAWAARVWCSLLSLGACVRAHAGQQHALIQRQARRAHCLPCMGPADLT